MRNTFNGCLSVGDFEKLAPGSTPESRHVTALRDIIADVPGPSHYLRLPKLTAVDARYMLTGWVMK